MVNYSYCLEGNLGFPKLSLMSEGSDPDKCHGSHGDELEKWQWSGETKRVLYIECCFKMRQQLSMVSRVGIRFWNIRKMKVDETMQLKF